MTASKITELNFEKKNFSFWENKFLRRTLLKNFERIKFNKFLYQVEKSVQKAKLTIDFRDPKILDFYGN